MSDKNEVNRNGQHGRQPFTVKLGGVTVTVRPVVNSSRGYWQVVDYSDGPGKRRLLSARNVTEARAKAKAVAEAIIQGRKNVVGLKDDDLLAFARAKEALAAYSVPVDVVVHVWLEAVTALKEKGSIMDAVRYFLSNGGPDLTPTKFGPAKDEFLKSREATSRSPEYLRTIKARLKQCAEVFGDVELQAMTQARIEEFIHRITNGTTQRHFRSVISSLFIFAQTRAWVRKDFNPAEDAAVKGAEEMKKEIFTPEEFARMLSAATTKKPELVPYLVVAGMLGLRPSEIATIRWEDFAFYKSKDGTGKEVGGWLRVPGATKTGLRNVPIQPAALTWLLRCKATGLLLPQSYKLNRVPGILAKLSGVPWRADALRHSYSSYRFAVTHNIALVAEECGHDVRTARKHYCNRTVLPEQGEAWFAIMPSGTEKVVAMPEQATA